MIRHLVFQALPDEVDWQLAIDFVKRVLPDWEQRFPDDNRPHEVIRAREGWLRGDVGSEELKSLYYALADTQQSLHDAGRPGHADWTGYIWEYASEDDELMAGVLGTVQHLTRKDPVDSVNSLSAVITSPEYEWQTNRLRQYLTGEA